MKMAILGAGWIADVMARTMVGIEEVSRYAVASRDIDRARKLADTYGFEKAYGSYEELVQDPEVELVYIATPHSHHFEHAKLCLEHGKPVLCEKAFTANALQAEELIALAKEKGVFLTEAMWTRYMPLKFKLDELLASGVIGKPMTLSANLGYANGHIERMMEPALAGGALLDLGVYPINFALMSFGTEILNVTSTAVLTEKGVDSQNSITLTYQDGRIAVLYSTMETITDQTGIICGTQGSIVVEHINNPESLRVFNANHEEIAFYEAPEHITGYEYEVQASVKAIREGKLECEEMPHLESLRLMKLMDDLRKSWGVRFPFE